MSKMHGGKGDTPRPFSISLDKFDTQWEQIFGKGKALNKPTSFYGVAPKQEGVYWSDDPQATIEDCKEKSNDSDAQS